VFPSTPTGKSTFLASVTRAKPKIANYPFTTVIPNLGVWIPGSPEEVENEPVDWVKGSGKEGLVLCDVPGLIAGAADGVGLGHAFLRHVERCHVILHLIDATSNDPIADFEMLNREIVRYGTGQLAQMPQVAVVNKVDAFEGGASEDWEEGLSVKWSREELEAKLCEVMPHTRLMWMSAKEKDGVEDLMSRLATFVKKVKDTKEP
jgi:GTP-binding protein